MGRKKSTLYHRKQHYSQKLTVHVPLKYYTQKSSSATSSAQTSGSLESLHAELKTIDLGQWCLMPLLDDKLQVCKFDRQAAIPSPVISVTTTEDLRWTVYVPSLTSNILNSSDVLKNLPSTFSEKDRLLQLLHSIDHCKFCVGNDYEKYLKVIEAHKGIVL